MNLFIFIVRIFVGKSDVLLIRILAVLRGIFLGKWESSIM